MPTVEFYYMPESPPSRAVEMVANMAGVTLNKHLINLMKQEHLSEEYAKLNPLRKVPFIVDGDLKLAESRAIAAYLVNKYMPENNTLYPRDPVQRARVDELLHIDMGILYQARINLLKAKLFGPVKELDADAEKAYKEVLKYLDDRINNNGDKKFFIGDHITIADVSLVAAFAFAEACDYDMSEFKHLTACLNRVKAAIPKYNEINDGPVENLRKYIQSKQAGQ